MHTHSYLVIYESHNIFIFLIIQINAPSLYNAAYMYISRVDHLILDIHSLLILKGLKCSESVFVHSKLLQLKTNNI